MQPSLFPLSVRSARLSLTRTLFAICCTAAWASSGWAAPPEKPAPPAAKPAAAAAPAHPASCEVEFFGKIVSKLPAGLQWWVYVADGDCLAKDATILGNTHGNEQGGFTIEVFSKWGANLTMCAAAAEAADKPTTLYGKVARKFPAQKEGEVVYDKVEIAVKKGPAHTFPKANPKAGQP